MNAKVHDVLKQQAAPFTGQAQELLSLAWRFNSVQWGNDGLALVTENWWKTRDTRTWRIQPGYPNSKAEILFSRKSEDQYANPGTPVMTLNQTALVSHSNMQTNHVATDMSVLTYGWSAGHPAAFQEPWR